MTQEQTNLIFDLICQKFKTDLITAELHARVRQMVAEEEAKLWQELMVKELETRVATAVAAATAPMAVPQKRSLAEKDNITGKVPLEVINITFYFGSLA